MQHRFPLPTAGQSRRWVQDWSLNVMPGLKGLSLGNRSVADLLLYNLKIANAAWH